MYFICSVLFVIIGLFAAINPLAIVALESRIKYKELGEPTSLHIFSIRFGGAMFALVGLVYIILS